MYGTPCSRRNRSKVSRRERFGTAGAFEVASQSKANWDESSGAGRGSDDFFINCPQVRMKRLSTRQGQWLGLDRPQVVEAVDGVAVSVGHHVRIDLGGGYT